MSALQLLVCPICHRGLVQKKNHLECSLAHRFPLVNGIPVFFEVHDQHHKHQQHYFEQFYAQYKKLPKLNWHKSYWQIAQKILAVQSHKLFVDLGTGTGWLAIAAAKSGCQVIAIDLTHKIVNRARHFAIQEGVADHILFVVADAERLPLRSKSVDYLTAVALIEHLLNDQEAAQEFARVLNVGGKLWIVTPNHLSEQPLIFKLIFRYWDRLLGHIRHYSVVQLEHMFRPFQLRIYSTNYIGHLIKLWQFVLHAVFRNDRLWWRLDAIDRSQHDKPSSINIAVAFTKTAQE